MPLYAYKCRDCGLKEVQFRIVPDRNRHRPCSQCRGPLARDLVAEGSRCRGNPRDWVSVNAGVMAADIARANRHYARMGVRFDAQGRAHVPGRVRKRFLKERGMTEL